jgi:hypothetical protein
MEGPIRMSTMTEDRLAGRLVAVAALEAGLRGGTVQELIAGATAEELRFAVAMLSGLYAQTLRQRCPDDWPLLIEALRHHSQADL